MWRILKPEEPFPSKVPVILTQAEVLPPFPPHDKEKLEQLSLEEEDYNNRAYQDFIGDGEWEDVDFLPPSDKWTASQWGYREEGFWLFFPTTTEQFCLKLMEYDGNSFPDYVPLKLTFAIWEEEKSYPDLPPTPSNTEANVSIYI